jgi:hypothetical protein
MILEGFENVRTTIINGLTHLHIRITGDSLKHTKYNFVADVYIRKFNGEYSVTRIDTKDEKTLKRIVDLLQSQ